MYIYSYKVKVFGSLSRDGRGPTARVSTLALTVRRNVNSKGNRKGNLCNLCRVIGRGNKGLSVASNGSSVVLGGKVLRGFGAKMSMKGGRGKAVISFRLGLSGRVSVRSTLGDVSKFSKFSVHVSGVLRSSS